MKYHRYILCLLCFVFCCSLYGQEKSDKTYRKDKRREASSFLERAREVKDKSPTHAIKMLEEAVLDANRRKDWQMEGDAYVLLGNIYENIGQKGLAIQRYEQSLEIFGRVKGSIPIAGIHQRLGQLYVDLNQDKAAEKNFQLCLKYSADEQLTIKCEEGMVDVELLRGNVDASVSQLDFVSTNYQMDSLAQARVEARRSQAYIQQSDYTNASESFYNSLNALPKKTKIEEEDYAPIEKAQEELLNFKDVSNTGKIELQNQVIRNLASAEPNDQYLRDNLKIAALYEAENNLPEATKFIAVTKKAIRENTDASLASDVYKKSAELNQRQGKVAAALDDLDKYIAAKEESIQNLEGNLKQQIEIVKGQKQIDEKKQAYFLEETERELFQSQLNTQKTLIGFLSLLLIASLIYFYFLVKNVKAKRRANQLLLLKSLRTQMNPHFIFNALNSVNNFIAKNDEKSANKFLSEFSLLMRRVLDYSQRDFIPFAEEIELNQLYLKLEHFRFRDKFDYTFENNAKESGFDLEIPPMLIQPFIENAVWHGLRYKKERGHLSVKVEEAGPHVTVEIKDNGIGRMKSKSLKTESQKKYKSTGLENISKRVALINELYHKNYEISVEDADQAAEDTGTLVRIRIPIG